MKLFTLFCYLSTIFTNSVFPLILVNGNGKCFSVGKKSTVELVELETFGKKIRSKSIFGESRAGESLPYKPLVVPLVCLSQWKWTSGWKCHVRDDSLS